MQLPSKRGGLAHALAALFAAVLVASCGVALATPQAALAMTTEKATAKPNDDGGFGVMGAMNTRLTWEGTV